MVEGELLEDVYEEEEDLEILDADYEFHATRFVWKLGGSNTSFLKILTYLCFVYYLMHAKPTNPFPFQYIAMWKTCYEHVFFYYLSFLDKKYLFIVDSAKPTKWQNRLLMWSPSPFKPLRLHHLPAARPTLPPLTNLQPRPRREKSPK